MKDNKIILASKSPRRRKLLEYLFSNLLIIPSSFDENLVPLTTPDSYVRLLSYCKTESVAISYPNFLVIGADTIVTIDNEIFGKPSNRDRSVNMLKHLSGRIHQVYTGYTIRCISKNITVTKSVLTDVEFKKVNDTEIDYYISTEESFDKSGGYAIQGVGSFMIKRINGSFTNVMGLPICELLEDLDDISKLNIM